jgi:DNA-binding NtrC family response regulator
MPDKTPIRLMIVADEPAIRFLCAATGRKMGLSCVEAGSAEAALQEMESAPSDMVLSDLKMGQSSGMHLLAEVKRRWPLCEVALMSAYGSIESAVQAMRLGAYDFLVKPFGGEELQMVLERMTEKVKLVRENEFLRNRLLRRTHAEPTDLDEVERRTIEQVFQQVGGDKEQACKLLGISRATLYRKIKLYGIRPQAVRSSAQEKSVRDAQKRMIVLSQT